MTMEEDLRNYKLQLQQVEAALTTDPDNEELIKLKGDLGEVIELTQDLLKTQQEEGSKNVVKKVPDTNAMQSMPFLATERDHGNQRSHSRRKKWKVGDRCLAKWEENGQNEDVSEEPRTTHHRVLKEFYEAVIEDIIDSTVRVLYRRYNQMEICHIDELKDIPGGAKRLLEDPTNDNDKHKVFSRDYLKKKKQKKLQRFKQIEEERESEKNKWLSFSAKSSKKSGVKGKSIFASPDNVNGRVGIGTCGISGKPMTEFSHGEMWRKGT